RPRDRGRVWPRCRVDRGLSSQQAGRQRCRPFPRAAVDVRRARIRSDQGAGTRHGDAPVGDFCSLASPSTNPIAPSITTGRGGPVWWRFAARVAGRIALVDSDSREPTGDASLHAEAKELPMSLLGWCRWLEQTPLATAVSESIWLFPLIEGGHILALP